MIFFFTLKENALLINCQRASESAFNASLSQILDIINYTASYWKLDSQRILSLRLPREIYPEPVLILSLRNIKTVYGRVSLLQLTRLVLLSRQDDVWIRQLLLLRAHKISAIVSIIVNAKYKTPGHKGVTLKWMATGRAVLRLPVLAIECAVHNSFA